MASEVVEITVKTLAVSSHDERVIPYDLGQWRIVRSDDCTTYMFELCMGFIDDGAGHGYGLQMRHEPILVPSTINVCLHLTGITRTRARRGEQLRGQVAVIVRQSQGG